MRNIIRTAFFASTVSAAAFMVPTSAFAQQNACVALKAGSGYNAQMRIVTGSTHTDWSGTFDIGQTKCTALSGVTNLKSGGVYTVQIKAHAGSTATCYPANQVYDPTDKNNLVYLATGSVRKVHCNQGK